ncbi:invasin domain 3-containing protein [Delftia sp. HK171]|uniref:invasin domain 3-containing protein n=2 Tax=Pseudomonadota TaxID=1224 RepID=UPI000AF58078|nr:invasin domain 3-containing protein [Delftia sp. HK171]
MQMRWVQLMAIAIGKIIFLSYLLEKTGNIMHALNRLPGSAFFRKWRAAKCLFSLLLLSCAGISSTALAATVVFTVTDNSDAPNANATTPTTCVSTLGGTFAGACTLRAAIQAANYTLQTLDPSADVSIVFAPTLSTSVRTIQSGTSKDAAGNLHPYVDNQTVYVRCANTFVSGAQSGAVTGATNACGQTQMISGGDTGTTTGAGGAWYWLKGTVPAGTGSLTIDFGGVIQVQNWADSAWETFYLGGKNITLTNSPNMTCGEAVFVVGSSANNVIIDRVGLVNVAPTPAGEGTPFNCELYAEIHQGAQNVFFANSTINSAIWNGNYGNNKGSAISVAASNGAGTVSNIVVDNFTVTNLPNPIGGMQLEQFFQVMSNMTVNGLTIKNSNIALSPTGGNAPRAVVSVDGTISLANGIGLAVTGNTFSLPIAAYTGSSPTHVSAPTVNTAASGTTQVVTVTDNNFTGGGDGVNIGGTGTAPGLIGNNKMTSQSRSAIRITTRDFFKISQNTLFSVPVAANSGISLLTTGNGQTGWTPTLGVGASDTAACTWTFNITANANASEPAPYTVEAFWSPTGAGVNDAQVYLGSETMAGASGTLTVPSYLSGQVRVTVTDSNSGGAQTSQLSTAASVTGFPCALKSGVLATTNNQPVGSSDLLEVYIVDGQGNAWTGGSDTVTFAAPPAGVTFNGSSAAVSCTTNSSGKCASPINASSSVAGAFTTPVTLSSSVAGATFSNLPLGGSPVSGAVTYQPSPVAYSFTGLPASTSGSEIAASPPSIAANGVSTSTLAVQLKDALGNLVTTCTDTVAFTLNAGTQGVPAVSVTGCSAGMYTGTVTSPVLVGSGTFGFTINGSAAVATATVSYVAATPSTSASTIVATPTSIVANGSSTSVLRVQLVDASSNPINTCTNTVAFTLNGGTQGTPSVGAASCTAGIYTGTVTSPTAVGSGIFGFTINGSAAVATASVSYTAGPPSTSASTIVASPTSIIANGTATSTLTAQLKDASGNSIATCANTVAFTLNSGTQGSPAVGAGSCSAGVYTATVTAPTAVGSGTFGFTINGSAATATAVVNYTAGPPSNGANGNLISASPLSVVADNTATSSISVTLRDANGNPATDTVAHTIVFTKTGVGTTTPAAPTCTIAANANPATCSVTVKSATVGTASFTATDNGTAVSNGSPVSVNFIAGPPSNTASGNLLSATPLSVMADGTSTGTVTVALQDANGNATVDTVAHTIGFVHTGAGTPSATSCTIAANANPARCSITVTSTVAGAASFTATDNNGTTTQSVANGSPAVINFTANAADPARSGVRTVSSPATANGSATDVLEAFVGDVNGNPVAGSVVTFSPTANITFSGTCTTNAAGTCQVTAKTTVAGSYTSGASIASGALSGSGVSSGGNTYGATAAYVFTAGAVDPANSTMSVDVNNQAAGGGQDVVSVVTKDAFGNPVTGVAVNFSVTPAGAAPATASCTTAGAAATCSVSFTSVTASTYSAAATVGAAAIGNSPQSMAFVAGNASASNSGLRVVSDNAAANGTATDVVEAYVRDAGGNPKGGEVVTFAGTAGVKLNGGAAGASATCTTGTSGATLGICSITATSTASGTYSIATSIPAGTLGGTFTVGANAYSPSAAQIHFVSVVNLSVTKANPGSLAVGSPFNYTFTVANAASALGPASSVTIKDLVPAGIRITGAPTGANVASVDCSPKPNTFPFTGNGSTVLTCTVNFTTSVAAGGNTSFNLPAVPTAVGSSTNTASYDPSGGTSPVNPTAGCTTDCSSTPATPVNPGSPTLTVSKANPGSLAVGTAFNYAFTVANAAGAFGPATSVTIKDLVPAGISITGVPTGANVASATCTPNAFPFAGNGSAVLTCTVNFTTSVAAGGSTSFNLPAVPTAVGSSTNTASYDPSGGISPVNPTAGCTTDCASTPTTPVTPGSPALTVSKANPGSLALGTPFNYAFTVNNAAGAFGPATSVTIKDLVPAGISITGVPTGANVASATCAPNTFPFAGNGSAVLTCTVNFTTSVAAGASTSFNLPAVPTAVGSSTNTASYDPSGGISPVNPTAGCTTDCASTPVTPVTPGAPALTVTKANPGSLAVGTPFNYAFSVSNAASAFGPATSVTIKDLVPAGISITGVPTGANVASATCTPNTFPFAGNGSSVLTCTVSFTTPVAAGSNSSFNLPAVPTAVGSSTNTASYDPSGGISPVNPTAGCTTDCASTPTTPVTPGTPALTVTKANPGSLAVGTPFNYAFTVANAAGAFGPGTSVTIKDLVPAGISITGVPTGANVASATCTPNTFPFVGNGTAILSCTVSFTTPVAAGSNSSFNLPAVPTAVGSSTNTASYDPSGGISPVNPTAGCTTDCASTPVTPVTPGTPALTVSKANPGSLAVGSPFNYTFTVANAAGAFGPANSVTIKDLVPAGIRITGAPTGANVASVDCSPKPNTFPFTGNGSTVLTCTVNFTTSVAAGGNTSFNLPAVPTAVGSSTNTASYDPSGGISPVNPTAGCTTDCASTPSTPVTPGTPALTVTKANPGSLAVGTPFNYAFTVANAAGAFGPATSVTIKDLVPAGISITGVPTGANVSSATCTPNTFPFAGNGSSVLTCTVSFTTPVAAGSNSSFNLPAVPTAVGSSTNTASYDPSGGISPVNPTAGCTTDCASTPSTPVTPGTPALTVTKANPGSLAVGTAFNYAFTVANAASAFGPATSVTIKDLVPAGISITGVPSGANVASATCTPNTFPFVGNGTAILSCTVSFTTPVAAGGNSSFNLPAVPTAVGSSTNTASYDPSGGISPVNPTAGCTTNCASTPSTPVTPGTPALTVTKANPGSLAVGTAFNYAFSVSNAASAFGPANSVTIRDLVPAGISITGVPTGANVASATCTPNTFPFAGNGSSVLTCTVNFTAAVAAGGNTSFNLPAVPTAVGSSTNTASYDPSGGISPVNPTAGCTTDCASTPVTPVTPGTPALTVTKANPGSLAVGTPFNYAFSVSNAAGAFGPATSVTIKDLVPAGISITGVPTGANVASATCTPNTFPFAGNGSSVLTCTVNFTAAVAAGGNTSFNLPAVPTAVGSSTNTASYDPSGGISPVNPTAGCTTDCASTPVTPVTPGTPALTVTKANPGSLAVGTPFNYAFSVSNAASAFGPATSVTIKDLVPAGISITGVPTGANVASATCTPNTFPFAGNGSSVLTCTVNFTAAVAAGGNTSFNLPAVPTAVGSSTNTASYDPSGGISPVNPTAGCTTNCASTPSTPVTPGTPALTVTKANPGSLAVGTPFNYAFSVSNAASAFGPATSVTIKDLVPAGISITGVPTGANVASATCTPNTFPFVGNGTAILSCTVSFTTPVAAGGNTSFNLPAVPTAVGSSTNTASYDPSGGISPVNPTAGCTTDCASTPSTPVTPGTPALTVTKANPGSLAVGTPFNYAFSVSNAASAFGPATSVTIKDLVPAGISITGVPTGANVASATCTPNTFPFAGNGSSVLTCTVNFTAAVAAGGNTSFNLPAVPTAVGSSTNTASYDPSGGINPVNPTAGCTTDCASTPSTPVTPGTPALTVTKANPGSLAVGTAFNYAFSVSNAASAFGPATSVTIKDLVPAGISITGAPTGANVASATCTPNTFPFVGNGTAILSCTVSFTTPVAAGGNSSFNLPAVPTAVGSSTNTASYDPAGGISPVNPTAGCTVNCASTPATPVTPSTQVPVAPTLTVSPTTVGGYPQISGTGTPGYTITVKDGSTTLCTAIVAADQTWSCTPGGGLPTPGLHTISATQTNPGNGNTGPATTTSLNVLGTTFTGPTATGAGNATATLSGGGAGCGFDVSQSSFVAAAAGAPGQLSFPYGNVHFVARGCTASSSITVSVTWPGPVTGMAYWKFGPASAGAADSWYQPPGAVVSGNTTSVVVTDGGQGDDDRAANGVIVDPSGPARVGAAPDATPIPALEPRMLAMAMLLMLAAGLWNLRRRRG